MQSFLVSLGLRKRAKEKTFLKENDDFTVSMHVFSLAVSLTFVAFQCSKYFEKEDQHDNMHFQNYARALLEPLPQNAVLLVNYDMQWTAIRYMQRCFGMRPDITAINLSMMTFAWFKKKRHHYPQLVFPGGYYSSSAVSHARNNENAPFSMFQFLEANANTPSLQNGSMGGIFLCGKLSFPDSKITETYETIPYGLTQTFVKKHSNHSLLNPAEFHYQNLEAWKVIPLF